jgi:hypothetical protein
MRQLKRSQVLDARPKSLKSRTIVKVGIKERGSLSISTIQQNLQNEGVHLGLEITQRRT